MSTLSPVGSSNGDAQRHAARNDRHLVAPDRICGRQRATLSRVPLRDTRLCSSLRPVTTIERRSTPIINLIFAEFEIVLRNHFAILPRRD